MLDLTNPSTLLTGAGVAAAVAGITAFWSHVKGFARYLSGLMLSQRTVYGGMCMPVANHLRRHYRKLPSGISTYRSILGQIDDQALTTYIPFDMPSSTSVWYGKRGIFVVSVTNGLLLLSVRGISDPQQLVCDALNEWQDDKTKNQEQGTGNFYVTRVLGTAGDPASMLEGRRQSTVSADAPETAGIVHGEDIWQNPTVGVDKSFMYEENRYVQNKKHRDPLRGLFFNDDVHNLIASLRNWYARRDWYTERGIPWRTGALLHGPGGTGKSSLARAVAEMLGIPLYQYYLNTLTDREFVREWDNMNTPCVVALEDFDTVFHGREPVTVHKSLSFECVLNQISGISSINGVLLIVTTNVLHHVDPALGQLDARGRPTRPGRIDHILHLGETTERQRRDIARYVLQGWADDAIEDLVASGIGSTAAQFQSECSQLALKRLSGK